MSVQARVAVLGGADPSDPLDPDNRVRHTAVGALVLAVATWALIATTFTFHKTVQLPWPIAAVAGVLVATIIVGIDIALTSTPLKKDTFGSRVQLIAVRGTVSVAVGLVIAHATILLMYGSGLNQIIAGKNEQSVATDTGKIRAASPYPGEIAAARRQINSDNTQITAANTTLATAGKTLAQRKQDWLNDRLCVNGTNLAANGDTCGAGNVANQLKKSYNDYLTKQFPTAQRAHDGSVAALATDIKQQKQIVATDTTALNHAITKGVHADLVDTGLVAQTDALWTLLKHDWFAWLWVVFFIVIDIAVGFTKGVLPESDFDRRRRQRREQNDALAPLVADDPVWHEVASHTARREAQVAMARADAQTRRDLARLAADRDINPGSNGPRPRRTQRRAAWAAVTALVLGLLSAAGIAMDNHAPSNINATSGINQPHHVSKAPSLLPRASASPAAFRLALPAAAIRAATRRYIDETGHAVLKLHKDVAALDAHFTPTECHAGQKLIGRDTTMVIAEIPDPTLQQLSVDELHEVAAQGGCHSEKDASNIHRVVAVTTERLHQMGVSA